MQRFDRPSGEPLAWPYAIELWLLAARSFVLATAIIGLSFIVARPDEPLVLLIYSLGIAGVWVCWWLASGGRGHVRKLTSCSLKALPDDYRVASRRQTAQRVAGGAPLGLAVAATPVLLAAWTETAGAPVTVAIGGSLVALGVSRAVEAAAVSHFQGQTRRQILHELAAGSRRQHPYFQSTANR